MNFHRLFILWAKGAAVVFALVALSMLFSATGILGTEVMINFSTPQTMIIFILSLPVVGWVSEYVNKIVGKC